jgi:hypothetical protein
MNLIRNYKIRNSECYIVNIVIVKIVKSCRVWMTIHGPRADLKMYELCSEECNKEIKLII